MDEEVQNFIQEFNKREELKKEEDTEKNQTSEIE